MLTIEQAAKRLGVSYNKVRLEVLQGRLRSLKVGRIYRIEPQDFKNYMEGVMNNQALTTTGGAPAPALTGAGFHEMQEWAKYLAESDLIPAHFQKKPANVFIALEYSVRLGMSPFAIMQSLYVVHGRPGWEGKFLAALVNASGLFAEPLEYIFGGNGDDYGCFCQAKTKSGQLVTGPKVTRAMVKAERWDQPKGSQVSKWKTMEDMMFRYRAASFFCKTVCPQVMMGLQSAEELEDVIDLPLMEDTGYPQDALPPAPAVPQGALDRFAQECAIRGITEDVMGRFLAATATANGCTPDEIKARALEAWEGFQGAFEKWLVKSCVTPPAEEQPREAIEAARKEPEPEQANQAGGNGKPAPTPRAAIGQQLEAIRKLAPKVGLSVETICTDKQVSALDELDFDTAGAVIEELQDILVAQDK